MICLLLSDVDSCFRDLVSGPNGPCRDEGRVVQEPKKNDRFGIYNAIVRDPDGYLVELQQFLDPEEHREFSVQPSDKG